MKSTYLLFVSVLFLSFSCSNNDDDNSSDNTNSQGTTQNTVTGDFFPLSIGNEWNYDVVNTNNSDNSSVDSTDELKVESVNGNSYTLSVNNNTTANGTLNNLLVSGDLTATDTQLTSTGSLELPIDIGTNLSIDFTDANFYDTTKAVNEEIYALTDVITQDFNGIPLTINYTLSSTQLENLDSYENNGVTYTNVTSARIDLNVAVNASITIVVPTTLPIIDSQNVLSITAYYADGIGLVYAEADSGFTLNQNTLQLLATIGVDLGNIPTSVSTSNTQTLTSYTVN